jgi:hypothetical protein
MRETFSKNFGAILDQEREVTPGSKIKKKFSKIFKK